MPLFTLGETVIFNGHKMSVDSVYNDGKTADLSCEIIPFIPTRCMGISYTLVRR